MLLRRSARPWTVAELSAPALIVAPHPDDETLGCGGVIAKKRQAGADVTIVFMTNGAKSHLKWMGEEELGEMRREEAAAAARVLGVKDNHVVCLDYEDGGLRKYRNEASERLVELLRYTQAGQVFTPYRGDVTDDHVVTHSIVEQAVRDCSRAVTVYEYPVWFWSRWPWSVSRGSGLRGLLRDGKDFVLWIWALLFRFRDGLDISDALDTKRRALAEHRSQTTRLTDDKEWKTLEDVAEGEFLRCFFQDVEPFCARLHARRP